MTPWEIICILFPSNFPRNRENDSAEAWDLMMEQIFLELEQVQSDWSGRCDQLRLNPFKRRNTVNEGNKGESRLQKGQKGIKRQCKLELFFKTK